MRRGTHVQRLTVHSLSRSRHFGILNNSTTSLLFQYVSSGLQINKGGPEQTWCQPGCVTSTTCTGPQQPQLLGEAAHFISKYRDTGINGNLLLLMNRSQIGINHVRLCPSRGHKDSSYPWKIMVLKHWKPFKFMFKDLAQWKSFQDRWDVVWFSFLMTPNIVGCFSKLIWVRSQLNAIFWCNDKN